MRGSMPYFPSGAAGAGLLLLRFSVAAWLLLSAAQGNAQSWQLLAPSTLALGLVGGFHTRALSLLSLLLGLAVIPGAPAMLLGAVPGALTACALALEGPGAFSIDARRFGRRTVTLPAATE